MKKAYRAAALLLAVCLFIGLAGCGSTRGRYRVLKSFGSAEYAIGFREGDNIRYYVEAAVNTLAAEGTFSGLALQWFGEDRTSFYKDADALTRVGGIPERSVIVGVDPDAFPMAYIDDNGDYDGFDVQCARAVCARLGWDVRFQSMKAENAYVELSSGNIDVAWGGLALDSEGKYTALSPYLTDDIVLVSRIDAKVHTLFGLKGKTMVIDVDGKYMTLLDGEERLKNRLGQIKRVTGGLRACFEILNAAQADATITTMLAVQYYAKGQ